LSGTQVDRDHAAFDPFGLALLHLGAVSGGWHLGRDTIAEITAAGFSFEMPALPATPSLLAARGPRDRRRAPIDEMRSETPYRVVGEGRKAQTLAWGKHQVLRLLRNPADVDRLERELVALQIARAGGVPVPRDFGPQTLEGRPGYLLERIDGPTALDLLTRTPWRILRVARLLATTHARIHAVCASQQLPPFHDRIRQAVAEDRTLPEQIHRSALERLEGLDGGDALCHWDYQPANVLLSRSGPVVIDWTFAARGHPAADVARTELILRIGEPPNAKPIATVADRVARLILANRYLHAYRRARPLERNLIKRWLPLVALPRLAAGIPGRTPAPTRDRRHPRSALARPGVRPTRTVRTPGSCRPGPSSRSIPRALPPCAPTSISWWRPRASRQVPQHPTLARCRGP
jgi:aminoglycoside phosphotransferase (APT) family kinase protein